MAEHEKCVKNTVVTLQSHNWTVGQTDVHSLPTFASFGITYQGKGSPNISKKC